MRTFILISFFFLSLNTFAQTGVKTTTFVVKGNCEDCKERIENAADIKGVKILTWNSDTKVASVTYNADKVSLEKIQQSIAAAGYDAGTAKGNDVAYKKLPKCCQYRDGVCEEPSKK
jgi:copper chaperone CopZ